MTRLNSSRRRILVAFVCLAVAACAVETPRDGFTTSAAQRTGASGSAPGAGPRSGGDDPTATTVVGGQDGDTTVPTAGGPRAAGGPSGGSDGGGDDGGDGGGGDDGGGGGPSGPEVRRASDTGVTADTITLSFSGQFSGALGAFYEKGYTNGFLLWVDDVNARGGINGRRVVMKRVDNAGTAEGAIAACRELTTNGSFAVFMGAAFDSEPSCLDQAGVPGIAALSSSLEQSWTIVKAIQSTPGAGKSLAHFVHGPLAAGGKKVGVVYSNEASFKACADFFRTTAQQLGIEVVAMQPVEPSQASFVSEVSRLRSAGAEVVAAITTVEILGLLRDAQAIGYRPVWTGVPWPLDEISAAARAQMEGIRALRINATADSGAYREYEALATRMGKRAPTTGDAAFYGYGRTLEHYLQKAGVNPTRESFVAALNSGESFDNGLTAPTRWSPGTFLGSNSWFPAVCCDDQNRWKTLGPASETFG